ncbi:FAD/NAD(P)-binding protein [Mycetohabitans sp. B8]|uniref:FAD/NAD(P)-binding protein n=1 Tax=Mycetohabitans sp. B8 TaxID=2841845 RepID=UPI001F3C6E6A|nr:FAD/NAD(P)-binding protein [Mycetohabitans sp. B8]MCG1042380.1 FAD/NAD(P)-binding protein [Mycetohabitans sp. B8]
MRVLQIGAGPCGVTAFRQLYKRLNASCDWLDYVIADAGTPGSGLAFGTQFNTHILNLPASTMSVDPDNPLEFVQWRSHYQAFWDDGSYTGDDAWSEFPPRRLFGQYASSVMHRLLNGASNASLVKRRVCSVSEVAGCNKLVVQYDSGESELFDKVILCVGHLPVSPLFSADHARYRPSPYVSLDVPPHASVGIIGSTLTAIDAVLALKESGHVGNVTMMSRSGKLPKVIDLRPPSYDSQAFLKCLQADPRTSSKSLIEMHRMEIERVAGGPAALRKQALASSPMRHRLGRR